MLRPALKHGLEAAVLLIVAVTALFGVAAWRLSQGAISADVLRPAIIAGLERQVKGGRAQLGHVGVVWFGEAKSLGLQLENLSVMDAQGRPVLRAGHVQAAVALDSLLVFAPAPGRIAATDFFVAISVSPQGRYELGYRAAGRPDELTLLGRLFSEVTGPAKRGRWASFLHDLELTNGQLSLRETAGRETAGPVSWTGDVRRLSLRKAKGRLDLLCDLAIGDGPGRSQLTAVAKASVGLKEAYIEADMRGLNPARIFPSSGITRGLSALDAQVNGHGSLDYALDRGVRAADVAFTAGAGLVRFGKATQRFDHAEARASYDPMSGEVELTSVKLKAAPMQMDLKGRLRLIPEGKSKQPARLDFELKSPQTVMAFVPGSEPQTLKDVYLQGSYTPEAGRLTLAKGGAVLAGATVRAKGYLMQAVGKDGRPQGRWGAKLEAAIVGQAHVDQAYPFWPDTIGPAARQWVKAALKQGRLSNVKLIVDVPPATPAKTLTNAMLKVGFDFDDVDIVIIPGLPPIEKGRGRAMVQGDRFDLFMTSGRMEGLQLSEGLVSFPKFHPAAAGLFKARVQGPAAKILDILDRPPLRLLARTPFKSDAFSGLADMTFSITRPSRDVVHPGDYGYAFYGTVADGGVRKVALGLDLEKGAVKVSGDNRGLAVAGLAKVGVYSGKIDFGVRFQGPDIYRDSLAMDGIVALDAHHPVPMTGRFMLGSTGGRGRFETTAATGDVAWTGADPGRITIGSHVVPGGLRLFGLPTKARADGFDVSVVLDQRDGVWRGPLKAGALSGDLSVRTGEQADVRFGATVSKAGAAVLGLSDLPLFAVDRPLLLAATLSQTEGNADLTLGGLQGRVGWARRADRQLVYQGRALLSKDDLRGLGAPGFLKPPAPVAVEAQVVAETDGLSGDLSIGGAPVRFDTLQSGAGRQTVEISARVNAESATRLGLLAPEELAGEIPVTVRLEIDEAGRVSGHGEADMTGARLAMAGTDWLKPADEAAVIRVDFTASEDHGVDLTAIRAEGAGMAVQAVGRIRDGQLTWFSTERAQIRGLFDGKLVFSREGQSTDLSVKADFIDARRLLHEFQTTYQDGLEDRPALSGERLKLDVILDRARLTERGTLKDVRLEGDWASGLERRLAASAKTPGGASMTLTITPQDAHVAVSGQMDNVGDIVEAVSGSTNLRHGTASLTGQLVPGGADLSLNAKTVRVARVPALAQILTLGSFRGVANTLNGEGIEFTEASSSMKLRGRSLEIVEARATGEALGLTTHGSIDLSEKTMDLAGAMAPAYALNSAVGKIPVLGALMISRQGEGVFGLTYSAKGPLTSPRVFVNPLSLATPGMLRRVFDGVPLGKAVFKAPPPKREP